MMMGHKAFKYRLFPNAAQEKLLDSTLYLCRQLYNAGLEERRTAYKKCGVSVSYYEQKPMVRAVLGGFEAEI